MRTTWIVVVGLAACGGKKDDKASGQPAGKPAETPADKAAAKPADTAAAPAGDMSHGYCHVVVTGPKIIDEKVPNTGKHAFNAVQWETPEERDRQRLKEETFFLNCASEQFLLSFDVNEGADRKVHFPMKPATYKIGEEPDMVYVRGYIGAPEADDNLSIMGATGTLEIATFDAKHIVGKATLDTVRVMQESATPIKIVVDFDLMCQGQSACGK